MKTKVFKIDPNKPEQEKIKEVARIIKLGGIVGIPTETVFGLGCDANNKEAIDKLYRVKKRSEQKPFTIQIESANRLLDYVNEIPPGIESVLREFWPGPLTAIIKTENAKVGFRIPDNRSALSIIKELGSPIALTSANIAGHESVSSAEDVLKIFDGLIEAVVDDGCKSSGVASTVIDFTEIPPKILRAGSDADKLKKFLI